MSKLRRDLPEICNRRLFGTVVFLNGILFWGE